ncbi:SIRT7 [Ramazzottius varieornatus]|uniref:protein acetyllysine N-acetyltransferase n=1 Tax=Ramazzottius varieornatus TaxID=947166 RepID=A0A1D1UJJ9_RAMVA|nr:SIRT7 [Ramazzottius varieornatus]
MDEESKSELSAREKRKTEQLAAILKREEGSKLLRKAKKIAAKHPDKRSTKDLIFIHRNERLFDREERCFREQEAARQRDEARRRETHDIDEILDSKCQVLAEAIKTSKHFIVYTGAGISTAANIPDYRGPNGVWTRMEQGQPYLDPNASFDITTAQPTFTHMALLKLHEKGYLKYIVSQNCDGLHVRSGFPREDLSEIHGNMYMEICGNCDPEAEYFRPFDVTTKTRFRRHGTGRFCHRCQHELKDTIVLFGEKSRTESPMNWRSGLDHAVCADVVLSLGSSLKILKDYPGLWRKDHDLYVVNLQWTPKDDEARLKINGKCDEVLRRVFAHLGLTADVFQPTEDRLLRICIPLRDGETFDKPACSPEGVIKPGWFGQGVKALIKPRPKDSENRKQNKKPKLE